VERFQLSIYLLLITFRNAYELSANSSPLLSFIIPPSSPSSSSASLFIAWTLASVLHFADVVSESMARLLPHLHTLLVPPLLIFGTEMIVVCSSPLFQPSLTHVTSSRSNCSTSKNQFLYNPQQDWLKHCFITKFNGIPAVIYRRFVESLYRDLAGVSAAAAGRVYGARVWGVRGSVGYICIFFCCCVYSLSLLLPEILPPHFLHPYQHPSLSVSDLSQIYAFSFKNRKRHPNGSGLSACP
jgi:hypothetical protein